MGHWLRNSPLKFWADPFYFILHCNILTFHRLLYISWTPVKKSGILKGTDIYECVQFGSSLTLGKSWVKVANLQHFLDKQAYRHYLQTMTCKLSSCPFYCLFTGALGKLIFVGSQHRSVWTTHTQSFGWSLSQPLTPRWNLPSKNNCSWNNQEEPPMSAGSPHDKLNNFLFHKPKWTPQVWV